MLKDVQLLFSVAFHDEIIQQVSVHCLCRHCRVDRRRVHDKCRVPPLVAVPLPLVDGMTGKRVECSAVGYRTLRHATE